MLTDSYNKTIPKLEIMNKKTCQYCSSLRACPYKEVNTMKGNDIDVLYTAGSSEIIQKVVFKVKRRCKESRQQQITI